MERLNKISLEADHHGERSVIQVVGHNRFLNELLTNYLVNDAVLHCRRTTEEPSATAGPDELPETCLVIIDATDLDLDCHWEDLMAYSLSPSRKSICAMFNADPDAGIDGEALRRGVRGLFFRNDALDTICKGIRKILEGEIWYRREALFNCIVGDITRRTPVREAHPAAIRLTVREQKILRHLSQGASNQAIADQLVVSIHTIKSHLYKIYRKINVPNRFQAILWVANNLDRA